MSTTKEQTTPASVASKILQEYDLSFLQENYEQRTGMSIPFNECKRHYVEYLLAMIASHSLLGIEKSLQLSPPLHVDVLWHSHILETKRYREFEKIVLESYRRSERETNLQNLDHSVVDNKVGREERIKKTQGLYQVLGFTFVNTDEDSSAVQSHELEFHRTSSTKSKSQHQTKAHPTMRSRFKRGHDDIKDDSTQTKKSKQAISSGNLTPSSVSSEDSFSSKITNKKKTDTSCADTSESNIYTFGIRSQSGYTMYLKTNGSTLFSKVSRAYLTTRGMPEKDSIFLLDDTPIIDMEMTMGQLLGRNELDGHVIDHVLNVRGC